MEIREGDMVSIRPEAVYYTGKEIPEWIKGDKWIVKSVQGDRVVIDKNVIGSHSISSPINMAFLIKEGEAGPKNKSQPVLEGTGSSPKSQRDSGESMRISKKGVELIAKYEGCRLEAYKCPAGVWTIGYGHTQGVKEGDILPSKEAAQTLLEQDLGKYAGYVNACMKNGNIGFPLNQNQFDALTSFVYNCGKGSLERLVSGRNAAKIGEKMLAYNKGGGKILPGLVRRRQEEHDLFFS